MTNTLLTLLFFYVNFFCSIKNNIFTNRLFDSVLKPQNLVSFESESHKRNSSSLNDLIKNMGKKNRDSNNHNNKENGKNDNESDYLEDSIGVMGIWQIYVCVVAASTRFIGMGNMSIIVFLTPITDFICIEFEENTNITAEKMVCYNNCVKYEYKSVSMDQTIVTEFDLICEREWMASFAQSVIMFGLVIGVSLFGWISDR